jgi:hypothetical protein
LKSKSAVSSIGAYALKGGVGDRLLIFFWLRCRDLRERIDPAHDRTFFCFLLGFLDIEDLLELESSVDWIGVSGEISSGNEGLDFGDDSPDFVSPKKVHFLADLGVDGEMREAVALSISSGNDPRRFKESGALEVGLSAVLGRASCLALVSFD